MKLVRPTAHSRLRDSCCPSFTAGEEVIFSEIVGMTELNGRAPIPVKNCKAHSFTLEIDTTGFRFACPACSACLACAIAPPGLFSGQLASAARKVQRLAFQLGMASAAHLPDLFRPLTRLLSHTAPPAC